MRRRLLPLDIFRVWGDVLPVLFPGDATERCIRERCTLETTSTLYYLRLSGPNSDCLFRVKRFAGLSIPGRDTDCMLCSVFICALRSLYSALKSIPLHI